MERTREHVLVLAEINAADRGFRDNLEIGVAQELGVSVEALFHYGRVCDAIDRYGERALGTARDEPSPTNGPLDPEQVEAARRTARTIVEAALDIYGKAPAEIGRQPEVVADQARRILTAGLALTARLERPPLDRSPDLERPGEGGVGLER